MPALKAQCPECDTKLRLTVDGEGEHEVECPKCGHSFTASFDDEEERPAKKPKKGKSDEERPEKGVKERAAKTGDKPAKTARRRDEDEDGEEDDAPRRKKKKKAAKGGNNALLIGGAVAGVLLLGTVIAVVAATSGKGKDTSAQNDPPAAQQPAPPQLAVQVPGPGTPGQTARPQTNPGPKPNSGTNTAPNGSPGSKPKPKVKDEAELATTLPPPPRIKISGSAVPTGKPIVKPPSIPPLAPDEDPFVRAANFRPDGPLPKLPSLPDQKQRPLLTLEAGGHTDLIGKVFFTPGGDHVITVANDKAVRIWDLATNETLKTIRFPAGPGKEGALQAAAISRNGKQLAVAGHPVGNAKTVPIYLVSPETGLQIKQLNVATDPVSALHFSNDGKWLAAGCEGGSMYVINVASGTFEHARVSTAEAREVRYNPNPKVKLLATLGADQYVQLWNFATRPPGKKDIAVRGAISLGWSHDGRTLAIGLATGQIKLWTPEGAEIAALPPVTYKGKPVVIDDLQFLPGDNEIAACGYAQNAGGWAGVVSASTGKVRVAFTQHSNVVKSLDVSPDGTQVVTSGGSQHESYVWGADDGKVRQRFVGGGNAVWALGWSKDGKSLAWGASNVRDENGNGKLEFTFRLDEFGVGDAPDPSKYVQRVTSDEHAKITSGPRGFVVQTTGRDPTIIPAPRGEKIFSTTLLPKGNAVMVAASESLRLLTPATLKESRKFVGHTGYVLCVTPSPDGRLFATGSSDQTIRIWQRDHEEPLLSVFVSGRDWIAWTPQGYYACSGQGERLIAWQLPASANKVPQVHPAERFRASMYQPALLKYVIPSGDLPKALAMAQKYDKSLVQTTSVADVIPPEVALDGFGDAEVKVDKDVVTVKATAKSAKHPITAMRLLVDGRPFMGTAGVKRFGGGQKEAEASWEVHLAPGAHTFAVVADSPVSKGVSKVGVAVRPGEPPRPNLYVLAMGVSEYPGKLKLNYCATDAELLAKTFKEKSASVFNSIEVKVLTDKQATKKGILDGLDWLKSKMTAQDVGIVSFSGHGTRDPLFGQFYLCPADVDPRDQDFVTFVSGKVFKEKLENIPGRLVAILDACHSGAVAEKERPLAQPDGLVRDLTAEDSGVIVMCASAGRESAIENKVTKAGFYTFGLVEGLSGLGDVDGDGVVYIHELDMYATARVRQLSMGTQNPTLGRPSTVRPFPIAKVGKSAP
jgi:WD40 repeat protein